MCGNYLYIIGGAGQFSIIQDNMFWYNFKEDKWSPQITLPCQGMQIKCCCWGDRLILLNINNKCGYIFDEINSLWCKLDIQDDKELVPRFPDKYAVFAYHNSIYIKGDCLIKMKIQGQKLVVVECRLLEYLNCDLIDAVICDSIIYTLYKHTSLEEGISTLSFEKYFIDIHFREYIFKDINEGTVIDMESDQYVFRMSTNIFGFPHYELVTSDNFVNDLC